MGGPGSGRRKQPTALRAIDGGKAPARSKPAEPKPPRGRVPRPVGLSARARVHWDRLAPELEQRGVLTRWDVNLFAAYCEAVARREDAQKIIARDGLTIEGQKGNVVKHPAVQIERDATDQMNRLGGKFGLSPSDRAGLAVKEERPERGLHEFR